MEKELLILNHLIDNAQTPQREIARSTGLSLGTVNMLLKRMTKKGLVKIERLNKTSLKYILTPRGMAEKSRLAYEYTVSSYIHIKKVYLAVQKVLNNARAENSTNLNPNPNSTPNYAKASIHSPADNPTAEPAKLSVLLFGPGDEFGEILAFALSREGIPYTFTEDASALQTPEPDQAPYSGNNQEANQNNTTKPLIMVWKKENEQTLKDRNIKAVNIARLL